MEPIVAFAASSALCLLGATGGLFGCATGEQLGAGAVGDDAATNRGGDAFSPESGPGRGGNGAATGSGGAGGSNGSSGVNGSDGSNDADGVAVADGALGAETGASDSASPDGAAGGSFGGLYVTASARCGSNGACYTSNVLAAGACSCPAGFTALGPIEVLDDTPCPGSAPGFGWSAMYLCTRGTADASTDFAGAYQRAGQACQFGNSMAAGACECPAGTQEIELVTDGACWEDWHTAFCWNPSAPAATFGGAFERSDNMNYGSSGCLVANPATGGCSCPPGMAETSVRTVYGPGDGGCSPDATWGANLYVCILP